DSPFLSPGLTLVDLRADAGGFDDDIMADRIDSGVFTQFHDPVDVARSRADDFEDNDGVWYQPAESVRRRARDHPVRIADGVADRGDARVHAMRPACRKRETTGSPAAHINAMS